MCTWKSFVKCMHPICVIISITFLWSIGFISECFAQEKDYNEIRREAERRYFSGSTKGKIYYNGDYSVSDGNTVNSNIIVIGDIEINGEVLGSVIVIDGNMIIDRLGVIRGDAVAISGKIIQNAGGVIAGNKIETSWKNLIGTEPQSRRPWQDRWESRRRYNWENEIFGNNDVMIRYNRVEGLFLGADIAKRRFYDTRMFDFYGNVGYGFESEKWRYTIGLEKQLFNSNPFTIGVKGYDLTDSDDFWRIGHNENTMAALFIREDFLDFYNRSGFTAYVSQEVLNSTLLRFEYRTDTFKSMKNTARWSMFGGSKVFRLNPLIDEGDVTSVNVIGIFDTRNSGSKTSRGWWICFDGEYTGPDIGGDFDYKRYILDLRRFQPLSYYENLNFRIMLGSSRGSLPVQRMFYLGGISSLRGMRYKEFTGSSMFLSNVEYIFDARRVLTGPPSWFLNEFKLALFFDAGAVMPVGIDNYFDELNTDIMKHNMGIGIITHDEDMRVDFAWRTDTKSRPLCVTFRLARSF
ncbi:hypothetical protein AMJ80_07275 [bacterium SM23_31]|nr:MAG: hypothetical protein AMJ80_07275 [bacterium SM23_31]